MEGSQEDKGRESVSISESSGPQFLGASCLLKQESSGSNPKGKRSGL